MRISPAASNSLSKLVLLLLVLLPLKSAFSQEQVQVRNDKIGLYGQYDSRNTAENAITPHRMLNDGFRENIKPHMGAFGKE